jgi:prepilin-type N-terminal cleavage/methylation domain-containing protein
MMEPKNSTLQSSNNPTQAFTLVEVMLVVVIVLIATAIAVPAFRGTFKSTQMTDAVRSTIRLSRYARSMSILRQEECALSFLSNKVSLVCGEEQLSQRRLPDEIVVDGFDNLSVKNSSSKKTALFFPSGMNEGFEVVFSDGDLRERTLRCHPTTGKVTVDE